MGGIKIRAIGRTVIAIVTAPSTMKEMVRTSDSKPGRRSSLLPTSAENLSKILPCKENILYIGQWIEDCRERDMSHNKQLLTTG